MNEELQEQKEYIVVCTTFSSELEKRINELAKQGYEVNTVHSGLFENKQKYMATMKRK